jgi:hypothetical protein
MIDHELREWEGILVFRPSAALAATDFQPIAREIDPNVVPTKVRHYPRSESAQSLGWLRGSDR